MYVLPRVPTHDGNKNPIFCVIAYSPSKKLSLVQNPICMNLAGLRILNKFTSMDFLSMREKGVA